MHFKQFLAALFAILLCYPCTAQTLPTGFTEVLVASGISNPTTMAFAPDGRIFVCQQGGNLRVIKNGVLLSAPFLSLTVNSSGERGLIGIAFDPDFTNNQYIYLYHTSAEGGLHNRISRFTANGDVVLAGSEQLVIKLDPLSSATNHNGGALQFGNDGTLYVAVGDNANGSWSQNLDSYHGKILRINKNGSVPSGNPYATGSEQKKRIWAYGLRNPYTMGFQSSNGKLYINEVGQGSWEEINDATMGGRNFGWPNSEGYTTNTGETTPVYAYGHGNCEICGLAITGGTFFQPANTSYPAQYQNKYFFMDYLRNWIATLDQGGNATLFASNIKGNSLGITVGPDGNLYYLSRSAGSLYKIVYSSSNPPAILTHPASQTVNQGQNVTFSVTASGASPLSYQWMKNGENISGANASTYVINNVKTMDGGEYSVKVSNNFGNAISSKAILTILAPNSPPIANITSPVHLTKYKGGQVFSFSGMATDAEEGTLPATAFSWRLDFHHDDHVHDGVPFAVGQKSGNFTIPAGGETSTNVFYRLYLTVTDSKGLKNTTAIDLKPTLVKLTFQTEPTGLSLKLDGNTILATSETESVSGVERLIDAISPQMLNGKEYEFDQWSQGGAKLQVISTPAANATYLAKFKEKKITSLEKLNAFSFLAYPNPSDGKLYLSNRNHQTGEFLVELLDLRGREIESMLVWIDQDLNSLHFEKAQSGNIYFLRILDNEGQLVYIQKLILK